MNYRLGGYVTSKEPQAAFLRPVQKYRYFTGTFNKKIARTDPDVYI